MTNDENMGTEPYDVANGCELVFPWFSGELTYAVVDASASSSIA